MSITMSVLLAVAVIVLIYAIVAYNGLVQLKHNVDTAWANIDVSLKQRHDELPKLVEACKQYKQFEQDTLHKVTEARSRVESARARGDVAAVGAADALLHAGLGKLFAVVEAYPELKADERFAELMARITGIENTIADRRELYNESVNLNNVRIEQFPDLLVAQAFGFALRAPLRFSVAEKADPDLKALFS